MPKSLIHILIADDHPIFRQGLKSVIELHPNTRVVAEAGSGREALNGIASVHPDVVLLDIDMPLGDGFEVARELQHFAPLPKIVFLTLYKDPMHLNQALELGADGYLIKDSVAEEVVECIESVFAGRSYVSPALAAQVLKQKQHAGSCDSEAGHLTPAERRILSRLAEFKTSKQIAAELGLSTRTVENQRAKICEKLNLQGSHALVRFATQHFRSAPQSEKN